MEFRANDVTNISKTKKKVDEKHTFLILGDLFPMDENMRLFSEGDITTLFGERICDFISASDFTICNLEGALTNHTEKCRKTGPIKVAPTSVIGAYKNLGINMCLLANNHTTDGGHQGMLDTMNILEEAGINYIGAGRNNHEIVRSFIKDISGTRIGIYNVCETMYNKPTEATAGAWLYDEYIVCREIKMLKDDCDYLVVIYHGGIEKFQYPSPEIKKRFHRMADCGADMVISQHTHCIGCEEYYNGAYLLYGQGNFLLKNFAPGLTDTGLIIELDIQDKTVQVYKHLVCSSENKYVRYCEQQDLTAFYERSKRVTDEKYVFQQFQQFCDTELRLYLTAFKSPSKYRRKLGHYFPTAFKKWLYRYRERDLLFTLHTLRSEQNRETAIVGIEHLLNI